MTAEKTALNPWIIAVVISLATFMEVLDTSIANVSLTHIAGGLAAGIDESTWVLTTYLVANAVMMPISGWFATVLGQKRFYLVCVALFTASSLLCGLAPSLEWLLFFRLLQGIGGAGLAPVVQAMLADLFPPEKRGMAFSIYGLAVVFAPAIGPTLGGWITDNFSWHWIFLINVPIGIFAFFISAAVIHDSAAAKAERAKFLKNGFRVDWIGFVLCVMGLGALEFFMDRGNREDWFDSALITAMAVIAVVSLVSLVLWEFRQKAPIVDISLLQVPSFFAAFLMMFAMGFVLFGTTALLPQFLEQLLGYTAQQAGLALTAGGAVLILIMPIVGGVLVNRVSPRILVTVGLVMLAAALFHMTQLNLNISFEQVTWARVLQVIGIPMVFVTITRSAYDGLPPGKNNAASALINLARNLGGSVGIAVSTTIVAQRSQFHQSRLVEHVSEYNPVAQAAIEQMSAAFPGGQQPGLAAIYSEVVRQATMLSYLDVYWIMGFGTLAVIPLAFLLRRNSASSKEAAPAH